MLYVKIHKSENSEVVAVCDKELIGKELVEDEKELKISPEFYKGELNSKEEIIKILKDSECANLVGEQAVSCGIEAGIILRDHIIKIGGVSHAQFYKMF
jgi:hypothetical protein